MKNLHQIGSQLDEYDRAILWYAKVYAPNAYRGVTFKLINGELRYTNGGAHYSARGRWNQTVIKMYRSQNSPSVANLI